VAAGAPDDLLRAHCSVLGEGDERRIDGDSGLVV
jgi:hypothetical protein